ncbi:alpha/beta fold hydrolase [Pseudonocardia sp. CA-107938]|uniref:alpha/beta fold hydrolase n=1 Tax=Pseudonocardia sp. CA-107938 TaxID=3240021 RepID=UPI003D8E6883
MTHATVNGLDVHYSEHGAGDPLVLLHGGLLTTDLTFGPVVGELAKDRRVIGVELQGHGHTPDVDREFTLADLASDVVGVLDHLGLDRADVFGFSLGGLVTMELLTGHPDRVRRAVVASAHYREGGYRPEIFDPAQDSPLLPTPADFAAMVAAHAEVSPTPDRFAETARKTQQALNPLPGWTDDQLLAITSPTLIVLGDSDFVRLQHAVDMHELIPGSQLAVLPDHMHQQVPNSPLITLIVARFIA